MKTRSSTAKSTTTSGGARGAQTAVSCTCAASDRSGRYGGDGWGADSLARSSRGRHHLASTRHGPARGSVEVAAHSRFPQRAGSHLQLQHGLDVPPLGRIGSTSQTLQSGHGRARQVVLWPRLRSALDRLHLGQHKVCELRRRPECSPVGRPRGRRAAALQWSHGQDQRRQVERYEQRARECRV